MVRPCSPDRFRPATDQSLVCGGIGGAEHVEHGHVIPGRWLQPRPVGYVPRQTLRDRCELCSRETVLKPVAQPDEMHGHRLTLPPPVDARVLNGVHVHGVTMQPPEAGLPELPRRQLAEGQPARVSTSRECSCTSTAVTSSGCAARTDRSPVSPEVLVTRPNAARRMSTG